MDDERLAKIDVEKQNALAESNRVYSGLLQDNERLYNQQNNYANTWETTQNANLDKQLEFNTGLIEQQKEIARQNKDTESKKAKNDFVAYTNPYGLQAEQFASRGLLNSGVSETAKLGGYNTYQNRLATANKVMQDALRQYDNDINQARLNNDVKKAENALTKLKMQVDYATSYFNNKSSLSQAQLSNNQSISGDYFNRYNTVYNNIQAEKERAEAIRQYELNLAFQKEQAKQAQANWEKEYALSLANSRRSSGGGSGGSSKSGGYSITNTSEPQVTSTNNEVPKNESDNIFVKIGQAASNAAKNSAPRAENINNVSQVLNKMKTSKNKQNALQSAYEKGQINRTEFMSLAEKYKL